MALWLLQRNKKEYKQYTVSYHGDQSVTCPCQQKLVSRGIHTNPVHVINYEESQERPEEPQEGPEGGGKDQKGEGKTRRRRKRPEGGGRPESSSLDSSPHFLHCVCASTTAHYSDALTTLCDSMSTKNLALGCREGRSFALSNISALSRLE